MNDLYINFSEIKPFVRFANFLECSPGDTYGPRKIYDHQFLYIYSGSGSVVIDGASYKAIPGDIFYYGPEIVHSIIADKENPFCIMGFHFDFTNNHLDKLYPIGTFSIKDFNKNLAHENIAFKDFCGFPKHMNISSNDKIHRLAMEIVNEYNNKRIYSESFISGLFSVWLSSIARHVIIYQNGIQSTEEITSKLIEYININFNRELTNEQLGKLFNYHPSYLNKLILGHTGVSLRQYIIDVRIRKAIHLLINTNFSISEISLNIGYNDIHYFSRLFKKKTGLTPGQVKDTNNY